MKKATITSMFILLVVIAGCSSESVFVDKSAKELCFDEPIGGLSGQLRTVHGLFAPMDVEVLPHEEMFLGEIPGFFRFYPFGEIMEQEAEGLASFVIFITEGYEAEQRFNFLRITPARALPNEPEVFMEITQVANVTLAEMESKIISCIDFSRYPIGEHLQPTERFPFVRIRLVDGFSEHNKVTNIYIWDNNCGGVFVIKTQYGFEDWHNPPNFSNALKTFKIITEADFVPAADYTEPKFAIIFLEGMPELVRYYPYGHIAKADEDGLASYLIFIEDSYKVEQKDNLLRVTWEVPSHLPEVFMEIMQVPNTTVEEMEQKILADFDLNNYYFDHNPADESSPFTRLEFYEGFERDSAVINIYLKDNAHGGVLVITEQYFLEAAKGHGVRFRNSLKTLLIV